MSLIDLSKFKGATRRLINLPGDQIIYTRLEDGCRGLPVAKMDDRYFVDSSVGQLLAAAPDLLVENKALRELLTRAKDRIGIWPPDHDDPVVKEIEELGL